jgi:hypothetical protein
MNKIKIKIKNFFQVGGGARAYAIKHFAFVITDTGK